MFIYTMINDDLGYIIIPKNNLKDQIFEVEKRMNKDMRLLQVSTIKILDDLTLSHDITNLIKKIPIDYTTHTLFILTTNKEQSPIELKQKEKQNEQNCFKSRKPIMSKHYPECSLKYKLMIRDANIPLIHKLRWIQRNLKNTWKNVIKQKK